MIGKLQPFHIPDLVDLLAEMHDESPYFSQAVKPDAEHVEKALRNLMVMPDAIKLVSSDYKTIAGVMLGVVSDTWYSPTREACEMVLYVRPEYRGGPHAVKLIQTFEQDARTLGAKIIHAGTHAGVNDEAVLRLYEKLGYTRQPGSVSKIV